jgi:hypothetical protein
VLAERQADHQTARDHFREALALADQAQMPLFKALTSYGVFLCRRGGPRSALPAAEALRIADGCGAVWHAERARVEWRRAGGRSGTTPPGQLPLQEAAWPALPKSVRPASGIAAQRTCQSAPWKPPRPRLSEAHK